MDSNKLQYARSPAKSSARASFFASAKTLKNREKKNMASSSEAFEKFSQWKKDKTWLNVTVIERGKTAEQLFVRIGGVDEEASLVGITGKAMHSWSNLDVGGAEFSVEPRKVVASRNDLDWLVFEEPES
jgi:hypothetical protein